MTGSLKYGVPPSASLHQGAATCIVSAYATLAYPDAAPNHAELCIRAAALVTAPKQRWCTTRKVAPAALDVVGPRALDTPLGGSPGSEGVAVRAAGWSGDPTWQARLGSGLAAHVAANTQSGHVGRRKTLFIHGPHITFHPTTHVLSITCSSPRPPRHTCPTCAQPLTSTASDGLTPPTAATS